MEETVKNSNEKKSLFGSFLEICEAQEKQADAERKLLEEKYKRRTQLIYDFHDRQQQKVTELQQCLDFVSQHAQVLETLLRSGGEDRVPLSAALVRQAAALQRRMIQSVANATRIRNSLATSHHPQMDTMLAKMEGELNAWRAYLERASDATYGAEATIDSLQDLISSSHTSIGPGEGGPGGDGSPKTTRRPLAMCSTPIARE